MTLIRRMLYRLGPDLVALVVFTLLWMGTVVAYGGNIHFVEGSTVLPTFIALGFLAIAFGSHAREIWTKPGPERTSFYRRARRMARDWLPLIYLIGVYETLRDYTGIIRPDSIDTALYRLDVAIFGVEPVLWIQKFIHPIATDYFAFMYMLYFFLPMGVATLLYRANCRAEFRELALSCVLCMYVGYILYLLFPAGPPRFYAGLPFEPAQLTGIFGFYEFTQSQMDNSRHVLHHSSFPSLHAALSLLAVFHAWRYGRVWNRKWLLIINGTIALSIWIATIYLRHHWIVDLFAGGILSIISFYGAIWLTRAWRKLKVPAEEKAAPVTPEWEPARVATGGRGK